MLKLEKQNFGTRDVPEMVAAVFSVLLSARAKCTTLADFLVGWGAHEGASAHTETGAAGQSFVSLYLLFSTTM
jgi:hypothetical protein